MPHIPQLLQLSPCLGIDLINLVQQNSTGSLIEKSAIAAPVPRVSGLGRKTRQRATSRAVLLPLLGFSLVKATRGAIRKRV